MWFLLSCMQLGVLIQLTYSTLYILPKHKRYPRPVCVTKGSTCMHAKNTYPFKNTYAGEIAVLRVLVQPTLLYITCMYCLNLNGTEVRLINVHALYFKNIKRPYFNAGEIRSYLHYCLNLNYSSRPPRPILMLRQYLDLKYRRCDLLLGLYSTLYGLNLNPCTLFVLRQYLHAKKTYTLLNILYICRRNCNACGFIVISSACPTYSIL